MTNLVVELNLETIISLEGKDDKAYLAAAEYIKENWFDFITNHQKDFQVKIFCELEE